VTPVHDVVVVGGGPAGAAVAGALARRGKDVVLVERGTFGRPRIGESLGAEVRQLLEELGAWSALREVLGQQVPFRAVQSAWGTEQLEERHAIAHPLGEGWHVDRARFDEAMLRWAAGAGASVLTDAGACVVRRDGESFEVRSTRGGVARGRLFVDASGRGAPAGRRLAERRWLACDRQVAVTCRMCGSADVGTDLMLEAVEEGWWYSAPLPGGALFVALVTDADLVPAGSRRELGARFSQALTRAVHTPSRTRGLALSSSVHVVRAGSGCLLPPRGEGWFAVGDAAMSTDPLAGNGVARALRSAISMGEQMTPLDEYLARRESYYEIETRWPDATFWLRRRPGAWKTAPITLHPETVLATSDGAPARNALARAESLVPPAAITEALDVLLQPQPAHRLLERMRAVAPVAVRRLLVGLQLLLDRGVLRAIGAGAGPADPGQVRGHNVAVRDPGSKRNDFGRSDAELPPVRR
jgi:flavin-dependent dehydrogenase